MEGWEKTSKDTSDFFKQLAMGIDQMYDKFGMTFIPHFIRYGIIGLMVLSPVFAIIFMIFFDDDADEEPVQSRPKKPVASKKKERGEKID